jgi:hypothetical protein
VKINEDRGVDSVPRSIDRRNHITAGAIDMSSTSLPDADHFSTLSTTALQDVMRRSATLPLATLLNRGGVTTDPARRRIWRDSYWKGSFARDNPMGWEERLLTPTRPGVPPYVGGRFWKRFDEVRNGEASSYIVNYGIRFLPGRATVRQVPYPDDRRRFVAAGDDVLLLTYRNQPYRIVYDVIKAVDDNHCVGVMHLGTFPRGREFATFVMTRNNYPFEKMAVPDHEALFSGSESSVPAADDVLGSWTGYVVFLAHPELALHNQFNPPFVRMTATRRDNAVNARGRFGLARFAGTVQFEGDCARLMRSGASAEEIRRIDRHTLIGRRVRTDRPGVAGLRYVLVRSDTSRQPANG